MTPYQEFCLNLDHHGRDANTGIVFSFLDICTEVGFEIAPRRTTVTLQRNGRTIVMTRWQENGSTVVGFRLRGHEDLIVTVQLADPRALASQGNRQQRLRAMEAALVNIVAALY